MTNLIKKLEDFSQKIIVALDGPSASGKGHIGRELARIFKLVYFESGIVYRGLAYLCMQEKISLDNIDAIIELSKSDIFARVELIDLNLEEIGATASKISTIPEVRQNITKYLKQKVAETPRIIMEGRDIGTVVAPAADLKIFINADVKVRAERRYKQLQNEGKKCMLADVLEGLIERDKRDINRADSPLKAADDAIIVDTSSITPQQVIEQIMNKIDIK